jgi:two-component system phosphate regulon sensor histidine kinase PhoR
MTATPEPASTRPQPGPLTRLAAARWVVLAAAAALLLFAGLGHLSWIEALLALLAVAAAAALPVPKPAPVLPNPPVVRSRSPAVINPQLAAVVAALPEAALLVDRRGTILVGNDAAIATLGPVRRGEAISFTVRTPDVIEAVRAAAADGEPRSVEFAERVAAGRTFEAHVLPIAFTAREVGAPPAPDVILVTFRDLTAQRRVDRMRVDFIANASHELRTPLASLSGFIETLQGPAREDASAREKFLSIMVEQAKRMSRLIDDLLSLSRIELNEHRRPETVIDLVPIVGHVCDTLAPLARERGVRLDLKKDTGKLPVLGERDELIRLFENLIENALKYGASGQRVEVAIRAEPGDGAGEAVVSVRDFGPGIAPEHLPRLTERFYRVDVETSRAQGGTGLGLAIVKHILSRHRGRLAIESEAGKGATFTARFPLTAGAPNSAANSAA